MTGGQLEIKCASRRLKALSEIVYLPPTTQWWTNFPLKPQISNLWAPYTIWQAVLKGQVILRQKAHFGSD